MVFAVAVVSVLGTEETKEERVVEEWDSLGTPKKFLSSSSLCLLEGLSTYLSKAVCVSVCVCMPCVNVLKCVSGTCVSEIKVLE